LNKRKIRRVNKYLVQWKGFTAEHDLWKRKKNLENARKLVNKFEGGLRVEVRRQEKTDMLEKREFRGRILLEKYMVKLLYGWDNGKFKAEYLKKLERNWQR